MLVIALLYGLRRLERWLHQHIFKVGWLVTQRLQTTAILYYAFFLPGIALNQAAFWLAAGFLNVHAERRFAWPDPQHIGELQLGFIKLSKSAGPLRQAVISLVPFAVGLSAVSLIANNILNVQVFIARASSGSLGDVAAALSQLTSAPDFWLWFYLAFTISNTMIPHAYSISAWKPILISLGIALAVLFIIGAGDEVLFNLLSGPIANALNALSSTLAVVLGIDIFTVAVLGTIEAVIERITGNTATFKDGKLITLRRSEMLGQKKALLAHRPSPKSQRPAAAAGSPSVYKLQLPIPGPPGKEPITRQAESIIPPTPQPPLSSTTPARIEPDVIVSKTTEETDQEDDEEPIKNPFHDDEDEPA